MELPKDASPLDKQAAEAKKVMLDKAVQERATKEKEKADKEEEKRLQEEERHREQEEKRQLLTNIELDKIRLELQDIKDMIKAQAATK